MIVQYENSVDIIYAMAMKAPILHIHSAGLIQPTKSNLLNTEDYSCFGLLDKNNLLKGVFDQVQNKHLILSVALNLESSDPELLKEVAFEVKEKAYLAGMRKVQLTVMSTVENVADTLKHFDFLPEVKFRSHIFSNGNLYPLTEYGVLL